MRDFLGARKCKWHLFHSPLREGQQQPDWTATDGPFTRHLPLDSDEWWQDDLKIRTVAIQEWQQKMERRTQLAAGAEKVEEEDDPTYMLVRPLCNV